MPEPVSLATPCTRPECRRHPYNWHVPGPRCSAGPDGAPCPCPGFLPPADPTEETTVPVDIAALRATRDRREDAYREHFDGCSDCPAAPDGECARAVELRRAWDEAREAFAFQCEPPVPHGDR